jgi:hypothetical protein
MNPATPFPDIALVYRARALLPKEGCEVMHPYFERSVPKESLLNLVPWLDEEGSSFLNVSL